MLRGLAFAIVLLIVIHCTSWYFGVDFSGNMSDWAGLKREKKGSLDAVYIGASNVFAFWQPLFGWADHGIAVWSMAIPGLTCAAIKHIIIQARETQPDALYIISLNTFKGNQLYLSASNLHKALDYTPFSLNKLRMTYDMTSRSEFQGLDSLEFYLPIIRFHGRWDELEPWIFSKPNIAQKRSYHYPAYACTVYNIEKELVLNNEIRTPIPEKVNGMLNELLDYFDEHHVNALFVKSPQAIKAKAQGHMNSMEDLLEARGYPCLDLLEDIYDTELDLRMDFYNSEHTNMHGSLKFSKAVSDYLVE